MVKFADEATVIVSSGKGGDGCVAFRREKYVPMGGPSGGDGGRGGDVVFEVRRNLRTLAHLRYQQTFKAQNGLPGMGKNRYGKDGEDVVIPVPPGTIIKDYESGEVIKDFGLERGIAGAGRIGGAKKAARGEDSEFRWTFLKGGRGGWGNTHFATSVNQAPRTFLPGQPGKSTKLRIELQLIGDIGFVGFPNAGKSSLLDSYTNARPKIAPYPFTTKIPNLGMLHVHDRDIVLADIPGIIEGAHEGAGLGIRFLKHISRTAALAFLIDLSDDKWAETYGVLKSELESFSPELAHKRRVIIGTKLDLPETTGRIEELQALLPGERVLGISVFSKEGLEELKELFHSMVLEAEREEEAAQAEEDFFSQGSFDAEEAEPGEEEDDDEVLLSSADGDSDEEGR